MNKNRIENPIPTMYRKPAIVTAAIVGVGLLGLLIYHRFFVFHVTSTTPNTAYGVSYATPVVSINLNEQPVADGLSIAAPDGVSASYTITGSRVDINIFSFLDAGKTYTFRINNITSRDGHTVKNKDITFTTTDTNDLTPAEQALVLKRQTANDTGGKGDPIFDQTPYSGANYTISAYPQATSDNEGSVNLEITVFVTQAQADNPNDPTVAVIKQQALAYLGSLTGIDPSKYIITYTVQGS